MAEVTEQISGRRQGFILSSYQVSLSTVDVPRYLGTTGLKLCDMWLPVLLCADGGAISANVVRYLKASLDALKVIFCEPVNFSQCREHVGNSSPQTPSNASEGRIESDRCQL